MQSLVLCDLMDCFDSLILLCNTYIMSTQHLWSALGQRSEKPGLVGVEYL